MTGSRLAAWLVVADHWHLAERGPQRVGVHGMSRLGGGRRNRGSQEGRRKPGRRQEGDGTSRELGEREDAPRLRGDGRTKSPAMEDLIREDKAVAVCYGKN